MGAAERSSRGCEDEISSLSNLTTAKELAS
jgi:hypothetical protein